MKILFVTGAPGMPQMVGGSQRTSDALIRELRARGHDAQLACGLDGAGWFGLRGRVRMKIERHRAVRDQQLGYSAWRSWEPWVAMEEIIARARPDIAVVLAHKPVLNALAITATGTPMLMAFQDVEVQEHRADLNQIKDLRGIGNSEFTAQFYRERFGARVGVIHPIIDGSQYRTETDRRYVTFINPDEKKGLSIALAMAGALPEVPFLFVEGWPLKPAEREALNARLAEHPNITLHPRVSDMRKVYAKTRLLLAPSQWQEGYGRVATEAQFSAIPVLGSDRGGLPEAIGPGGEVVPYLAEVGDWVDAYRRICDAPSDYASYCARALEHASRPGLRVSDQISRWEAAIEGVASGRGWTEFL